MAKKRIELRLTLELETDDAEIIDVTVNGSPISSALAEPMTAGIPAGVEGMIEEFAPPSTASFQMDFAKRCISDLGLDLQLPQGERKYVNAYPPKRYGSKRAACFDVKSGRVEIYCRPEHAKGRQRTQVVTNNGEAFAVKAYLRSTADVEEAIEMTRIGLEERN